eukprot:g9453.t1
MGGEFSSFLSAGDVSMIDLFEVEPEDEDAGPTLDQAEKDRRRAVRERKFRKIADEMIGSDAHTDFHLPYCKTVRGRRAMRLTKSSTSSSGCSAEGEMQRTLASGARTGGSLRDQPAASSTGAPGDSPGGSGTAEGGETLVDVFHEVVTGPSGKRRSSGASGGGSGGGIKRLGGTASVRHVGSSTGGGVSGGSPAAPLSRTSSNQPLGKQAKKSKFTDNGASVSASAGGAAGLRLQVHRRGSAATAGSEQEEEDELQLSRGPARGATTSSVGSASSRVVEGETENESEKDSAEVDTEVEVEVEKRGVPIRFFTEHEALRWEWQENGEVRYANLIGVAGGRTSGTGWGGVGSVVDSGVGALSGWLAGRS